MGLPELPKPGPVLKKHTTQKHNVVEWVVGIGVLHWWRQNSGLCYFVTLLLALSQKVRKMDWAPLKLDTNEHLLHWLSWATWRATNCQIYCMKLLSSVELTGFNFIPQRTNFVSDLESYVLFSVCKLQLERVRSRWHARLSKDYCSPEDPF